MGFYSAHTFLGGRWTEKRKIEIPENVGVTPFPRILQPVRRQRLELSVCAYESSDISRSSAQPLKRPLRGVTRVLRVSYRLPQKTRTLGLRVCKQLSLARLSAALENPPLADLREFFADRIAIKMMGEVVDLPHHFGRGTKTRTLDTRFWRPHMYIKKCL